MKVYVVTDGYYSDYHIEAVFTSKRQAELYCALHTDRYSAPCVECYETDEYTFETDKEPKIKWTGRFVWRGRDSVFRGAMRQYVLDPEEKIEGYYGDEVTVTITLDKKFGRKKAEKIICDKFAEWKYDHIHDIRPRMVEYL